MGDLNAACTYDINADATAVLGAAAKAAGVSVCLRVLLLDLRRGAGPEDVLDESGASTR